MKRLTQDLKRALNALAAQDAAEFLSMRDKLASLGHVAPRMPEEREANVTELHRPEVVLLLNGEEPAPLLAYALDVCRDRNALLQVVMHGDIAASEKALADISDSDVALRSTALEEPNVQNLMQLLGITPAADWLIAAADDSLASDAMDLTDRGELPRVILMERMRRTSISPADVA